MNNTYNYLTVDHPKIPVFIEGAIDFPEKNLMNISGEEEIPLEKDELPVTVKDIYLPNFSVRKSQGKFDTDAVLLNTSAKGIDLLGSCLFLKGKAKSFLPKHVGVIESCEGTQNFKYDPQNEYSHRIPADTFFDIVHISMTPDYFMQFLPEEHWADEMRNKIIRRERILGDRTVKILRAQDLALQTIFNCPLTGKFGNLMMETAIVQIILLQLNGLFRDQPSEQPSVISKRDLELIQTVREHISETFLNDHSLSNLAKHFGTNTNKLITLFRKTFGKSIFEYIGELKMDHARQLLRDDDRLVNDVARIVGYKNPNHFAVAFKKRFGVNPSQVKC